MFLTIVSFFLAVASPCPPGEKVYVVEVLSKNKAQYYYNVCLDDEITYDLPGILAKKVRVIVFEQSNEVSAYAEITDRTIEVRQGDSVNLMMVVNEQDPPQWITVQFK